MGPLVGTAVAVGAVGGVLALLRKRKGRSIEEIPKRMRRLVLTQANTEMGKAVLEVEDVETPLPRSGQVLIKVAAAPVNPSDDGVWKVPPKTGYPLPLGNEGSGVVVATGGGLVASRLLGRKVAFMGKSYAEYAVVDAMQGVFSLPPDLPAEDACAFFVNPFTVVGIVDTVRQRGGKSFIHTAAASQLGQMLVQYCAREGMELVNVVRRPEQAELLRKLGAKHVIVQSDSDWEAQLAQLIKAMGIRHAFDCIAGETTGRLLSMLPPGGAVWVYGRLSNRPVSDVEPLDLIYRGKKVEGFLLTTWLFQKGLLSALRRTMRTAATVKKHLRTVFASEFKDTSLAEMHKDYMALQSGGRTGVKLRVRPNMVLASTQ